MNVNWNNLVNSISNGQAAYENLGVGSPITNGNVGFYDQPMGDFSAASDDAHVDRPNDFHIGHSRWGSPTDVVSK